MKKQILLMMGLLLIAAGVRAQFQPINVSGTQHGRSTVAGNIGIGTPSGTAPSDKLHVIGSIRGNQVNAVNGIYNTLGATNLSLNTNNTNRLTILNSNGNVGIGTGAPDELLHVNGNIRGNQFNAINGIYNTVGTTNLSLNTNNTNRLTILNTNGNVGIGTAIPAQALHVIGNVLADGVHNTSGTFRATGTSNLNLQTETSNRLTILSSNGFVGINKANPGFMLDVAGPVNATQFLINGAPLSVGGSPSQWTTAGTDIFYNTGKVGIGTATPTEQLHVGGTVLSNQSITLTGVFASANTNNLSLRTNTTDRLTVLNSNGFVGIGTATPEDKLQVTGGNVVLDNGSTPTIYTGTGSGELNRYLQLSNSVGTPSPSGLKAGGLLVSDAYGYASPGKNDMIVKGKVGIGTPLTANPNGYTLAVNGSIGAKDVRVEKISATWPDYVFQQNYALPSLKDVSNYIKENNHLEGVPSAEEVEKNGHNLGDMDAILLRKVEELTLYIIKQQQEIDALKKKLEEK